MSSLLTPAALAAGAARVWDSSEATTPKGDKGAPRGSSRTTSLCSSGAKEIINALAFAETLQPPDAKWALLTAVIEQSEGFDATDTRAYMALQGRILTAIRRFLRCRGLPFHCIWVREIGPRYGEAHTHVLLPLPPELRHELTDLVYSVGRLHNTTNNRAVDINANRRYGNCGIRTPASRAGVMRDLLKTMSPKARLNGERVMPALGIDNRAPCTIFGKRYGTSQSLSRAARAAAGWRELETLHELRAVLPTGEEAKQERDRRYREQKDRHREWRAANMPPRRRRGRKAAKTEPMPPPTRPEPSCVPFKRFELVTSDLDEILDFPDSADCVEEAQRQKQRASGNDLADDFLEGF